MQQETRIWLCLGRRQNVHPIASGNDVVGQIPIQTESLSFSLEFKSLNWKVGLDDHF
jgi:hypothetical protein